VRERIKERLPNLDKKPTYGPSPQHMVADFYSAAHDFCPRFF